MTHTTVLIQVTSFHEGPFGGGILIGSEAGEQFSRILRSRIPAVALPRRPSPGEVWRLIGSIEEHAVRDPTTGRTENLEHIAAIWARPVAPQGDAIRRWIAKHPKIKGVGEAYSGRLWDAHGPRLYGILRNRNVEALANVLDIPKAVSIVEAFGLLIDEVSALEDLDGLGLDARTATASIRLFGGDAGRKFRDNPYILSLLEPWTKVDGAALASGILPTDERRLLAAVDVAAARAFRTTENLFGGHTVVDRPFLRKRVMEMLGSSAGCNTDAAIELACKRGLIQEIEPNRYQARAPAHMEREIEREVLERLERLPFNIDKAIVAIVISEVEQEDGITFASEQREAVFTALSSGFSVITGGAGTGKSTVVKAIRRAHLRLKSGSCIQIALSGRAAKRLREASGGDTMTVYRFLKDTAVGKLTMTEGLLVVDEFSMVGTPDLWQILTAVPPEVDVVLVGDPEQLPPIKPGNPAAALIATTMIPKTILRLAQRQAASTGIPQVAEGIRNGFLPELAAFDPNQAHRPGVYLWNCLQSEVPRNLIVAFEALAEPSAPEPIAEAIAALHQKDIQILTMTRHGPAGAKSIGDAIERRWMAHQQPIDDWGFCLGSKLLWTKNSYDRPAGGPANSGEDATVDIMNGSLGVIESVAENGAIVQFDDGARNLILRSDLANILRGWAITIHKAQGSAFKTVIIPIVRSRMLDRAMIYTAVTRARLSAILIGEKSQLLEAVRAPAHATNRAQALDIDRAQARRGDREVIAEGRTSL